MSTKTLAAYTYESSFHHSPCKALNLTLTEAIGGAVADFETGAAWPVKITDADGVLIWEDSGPLTTSGTLKALATKHGVKCPEY